jgi:hypothetical protein
MATMMSEEKCKQCGYEFVHRVFAELLPRWCIFENVPQLRDLGADTIAGASCIVQLKRRGLDSFPLLFLP